MGESSVIRQTFCKAVPDRTEAGLQIIRDCKASATFITFLQKARNGTSLSNPDLTTAERKVWNSGFPPGITVDELWHYRRKRAPGFRPTDHLLIEEGKFSHLKSEYRRRFKNYYFEDSSSDGGSKDISPVRSHRPDDTFALTGPFEIVQEPEYRKPYVPYPIGDTPRRRTKRSAYQLMDDVDMALNDDGSRSISRNAQSEGQSQFVKYDNWTRTLPLRRPTNLKLEGDILSITEKADQFVEYLLTKRRTLLKNPTTLKLEGGMESRTETRDQYPPLEYQQRPPLCKKSTNLHLEGDLDAATENSSKFVAYAFEQRPPLIKRSTHLQLEGELKLEPEYRTAYVQLKGERPAASVPHNNLRVDGGFYDDGETKKFSDHEGHPQIPFLRGSDFNRKLLLGDDKQFRSAEYREKFVPHQLEKSQPYRRTGQLRPEGDLQTLTETRTEYTLRPDHATLLRSPARRRTLSEGRSQLGYDGQMEHLTEKRAQYIEHPQYTRMESLKREPELRMDGEFECQPEYRKAYIDYLIRERMERKPRPLDNLGVPTIRAFNVVPPSSETQTSTTSSNKELTPTPPKPRLITSPAPSTKSLIPRSVKKLSISSTTESEPSTLPRTRKSINKLETQLFGPKLTVRKVTSTSSRPSSRSTSPLPPKCSRSSTRSRSLSRSKTQYFDDNYHVNRTGARFTNTIRVDDLAYTPCTSPIPTRKVYPSFSPTRRRWRKDEDQEPQQTRSSFLVLDNDINNNECKIRSTWNAEQKWMPSWYSPSFS